VRRIRGENPPLGIYPGEIKISTISLTGAADLLVMTDGVTDALLVQGGSSYREVLEHDYREAPTLAALQRRFREKTDCRDSDDLTLMHLRRLDFTACWHWNAPSDSTTDGSLRIIGGFFDALKNEIDLDDGERDELNQILNESLHKVFELSDPTSMLPGSRTSLSSTLWRGAGKPLLILEIRDTGSRLSPDALNSVMDEDSDGTSVLSTLRNLSDSLFIGWPDGFLMILKTLEGGGMYADRA
jgi:hypothetical protein